MEISPEEVLRLFKVPDCLRIIKAYETTKIKHIAGGTKRTRLVRVTFSVFGTKSNTQRFKNSHTSFDGNPKNFLVCIHKIIQKILSDHGLDQDGNCLDTRRLNLVLNGMKAEDVPCEFIGCTNKPEFNYENQSFGRFCKLHYLNGMVMLNPVKRKNTIPCKQPGCTNRALYGYQGNPKELCVTHRLEGMVANPTSKKCEQQGCAKAAIWKYPGGEKRFCQEHKLNGMVHMFWKRSKRIRKKPICEVVNCNSFAYYGFRDKKRKQVCREHRQPGMEHWQRTCEVEHCEIIPIFNYDGESVGRFCQHHKLDGMISLNRSKPRCEQDGCEKIANSNYASIPKLKRFCEEHRLEGMVTWKKKDVKCEYKKCSTTAFYNFPDCNKRATRRFCVMHKMVGMVDVWNRLCSKEGCEFLAQWRPANIMEGQQVCHDHKLEGMVSLLKKKPSIPQCRMEGCNQRPHYAEEGSIRANWCEEHRPGFTINVSKKCEFQNCSRVPRFSTSSVGQPHFCEDHKQKGMYDLSRICIHEDCGLRARYGDKGTWLPKFCKLHRCDHVLVVGVFCKFEGCNCEVFQSVSGLCTFHRKHVFTSVKCKEDGCELSASFSFQGNSRPCFCSNHKLDGMVNLSPLICQNSNCFLKACYNFSGKSPVFCKKHSREGMINVLSPVSKLCEVKDCAQYAQFKFKKDRKNRVCHVHKLEGMIQSGNTCIEQGCRRAGIFCLKGTATYYCPQHKLEGMTHVGKNRHCKSEGCDLLALFGDRGLPEFCAVHKLSKMVLQTNVCKQDGCLKKARCNLPTDQEPVFCKAHGSKIMVDWTALQRFCAREGCPQPVFFNPDHNIPALFCESCAPPEVEDFTLSETASCVVETCCKMPVYAMKENPSHCLCYRHRKDKPSNSELVYFCPHPECARQAKPAEFVPRGKEMGNAMRSCGHHKKACFVPIHPMCQEKGCQKKAIYNFKGEPCGEFCEVHIKPGMVDVSPANYKCQMYRCFRLPLFNVDGETCGAYCAVHKKQGMIDILSLFCRFNGCFKPPRCNDPGIQDPKFCWEHRMEGMVDVATKQCSEENCTQPALFNREGTVGRFCLVHIGDSRWLGTRVKVHCESNGCCKTPAFNFFGEQKPIMCAEHRRPQMIRMSMKHCKHPKCPKGANFGFSGKPAEYCALHRLDGMKSRFASCEHEGCDTLPSYNYPGERKLRFCVKHKLEHMIAVQKRGQSCKHPTGCQNNWNYISECEPTRKYCKEHRVEGMVHRSVFYCEYKGCHKPARFGSKEEWVKQFCEAHRPQHFVLITSKPRKCAFDSCRKSITIKLDRNQLGDTQLCHQMEGLGFCSQHYRLRHRMIKMTAEQKTEALRDRKHKQYLRKKARLRAAAIQPANSGCEYLGCRQNATYGFTSTKSLCDAHKLKGMSWQMY